MRWSGNDNGYARPVGVYSRIINSLLNRKLSTVIRKKTRRYRAKTTDNVIKMYTSIYTQKWNCAIQNATIMNRTAVNCMWLVFATGDKQDKRKKNIL